MKVRGTQQHWGRGGEGVGGGEKERGAWQRGRERVCGVGERGREGAGGGNATHQFRDQRIKQVVLNRPDTELAVLYTHFDGFLSETF